MKYLESCGLNEFVWSTTKHLCYIKLTMSFGYNIFCNCILKTGKARGAFNTLQKVIPYSSAILL